MSPAPPVLLLVLLASSVALGAISHPRPGVTLVRHSDAALVIADLCAAGVSVRATRYAERRGTPATWANKPGVAADVAINADFFDYPGWTLVNGRARGAGEDWPADKQLFEVRSYWQFGAGFASLQPNAAVVPPSAATEIVGGHNVLIWNGQSQGPNFDGDGVITSAHRRTAIGLSQDRRHLYLFVSNASLTGNGIVQRMVQYAAEASAPAIWYATNMDGGGSSQLYVRGVGSLFATGREVNNHLGVRATGSGAAPSCPAQSCDGPCSPSLNDRVAMAASPRGLGYWITSANGAISAHGNRTLYGSLLGVSLAKPVVAIVPTPSGNGYWLAAADGGVFAFGDAGFYGSAANVALNQPIVGMAATPDGKGYWLVAADGGIFNFGNAGFHGSLGGTALNAPVVGIAATPDGGGYWLVASDGGVFALGNAAYKGSLGGQTLNAPIVGIARTVDGKGYWLVGADGGVFGFGNAGFHGSMGGTPLAQPVVGIAATPDGAGYWLVARDGGIFSFGNAAYLGSGLSSQGCGGNEVLACGDWQGQGCMSWKATAACAAGEWCRNGRCEASCTDDCQPGQSRCAGADIQGCVNDDADPCFDWSAAAGCAPGKSCTGGTCASQSCQDECPVGATRCSATGLQRCADSATGCAVWSAATACGEGERCEQGSCIKGGTTLVELPDGGGGVDLAPEEDGGTPDPSVDGGLSDAGHEEPAGEEPPSGEAPPAVARCGCAASPDGAMLLGALALLGRRRRGRR